MERKSNCKYGEQTKKGEKACPLTESQISDAKIVFFYWLCIQPLFRARIERCRRLLVFVFTDFAGIEPFQLSLPSQN